MITLLGVAIAESILLYGLWIATVMVLVIGISAAIKGERCEICDTKIAYGESPICENGHMKSW